MRPLLHHPVTDWQRIIDEAFDCGCRQIQFIGGEPVSHPALPHYIAHAYQLGYQFIEVYTNLALMTDTMVQTFANFGVNVATSFYSGHADVHDRITGTPGSFSDTLCGIRSVLAHGLTLRVGMIAIDEDDQALQEANELLCNLGVSQENIRVDRVRPVGRGAKRTPFESLEKTLCGACWEGKLAVSYDGTCYPCVFFRQVPVGNVTEQGIDAIVRSQRL